MRLILVGALCLPSLCSAQVDPFVGPERFPEYRNLSGLSGGGYGLDRAGRPSLAGPTAYSTPIAHTLGHSRSRIQLGFASFDALPRTHEDRSNGTITLSYGHTAGAYNMMITEMILAIPHKGLPDRATNLQVQIPTPGDSHWAGSIGVQGLFGAAKSHGVVQELERNSRSVFACGTYRLPLSRESIFLTAGIGTRRLRQGFASACYRVAAPLRVWVEHDGYGINEGVLVAWQRSLFGRPVEWSLSAGYLQNRYFTFATGIGF